MAHCSTINVYLGHKFVVKLEHSSYSQPNSTILSILQQSGQLSFIAQRKLQPNAFSGQPYAKVVKLT